MPCRDGGPDINDVRIPLDLDIVARNKRQQEKIDNLTRMLCSLCSTIGYHVGSHPSEAIVVGCNVLQIEKIPGLRKWWTEHQEFDKQRLAKAKQSALAKLTDDEKEALGVK